MDLLDQNPTARAEALKQMAVDAGFDAAGVAPPGPFPEAGLYEEWLDAGYHGDMDWLERHRRRRTDPDRVLRGVRSVVVVSLGYDTTRPRSTERSLEPGEGWISRYAWGDDYHDVMSQMLDVFCARLEAGAPGHQFKYYVDHGPVLEKVYARYAGLGWMGKHTNLIHPERGSFFFLAVILTDLDLAADSPVADHCGTCTACLDACPTDAFAAPYVLDARKCISYLTIEAKDPPDTALQDQMGSHVYGCDICQDVCPWNRKSPRPDHAWSLPRAGLEAPDLASLVALDNSSFDRVFAGSAIHRRGQPGLTASAERAKS